jgi:hypothetical protein
MPKIVTIVLLAAATVGIGAIAVTALKPPTAGSKSESGIALPQLHGWTPEGGVNLLMTPEEAERWLEFAQMSSKWDRGVVSPDDMNAFLKWSEPREVRGEVVVPRHELRLGEPLQFALVLRNPGKRPQIVFPFRPWRFSERGDIQNGVRRVKIVLEEWPVRPSRLYIIKPGESVVISFCIDPEPVGKCQVDLSVGLKEKYVQIGDHRGFKAMALLQAVIDFNILK